MQLPEPFPMRGRAVRVVVCDDSGFMRRMLTLTLGQAPDIEVVGVAATAQEAIARCHELRPDVLTLDLELPDSSGVDVLRELGDLPVRVLVVSSYTSSSQSERAVEALTEGAVDVLGKPTATLDRSVFAARLLESVRDIAVGTGRHVRLAPIHLRTPALTSDRLVVIGASTGGPSAVYALLQALPAGFPAPIVIVQHMPSGFSEPLSRRLDSATSLRVVEASDGEPLEPGKVIVAVSGRHLHIGPDRVYVRDGERVLGVRPSIDVALLDAAVTWPGRVSAVILTGIGRDGREGARAVRAAGGRVLAEHESTCAVYGMPRATIEAGLANEVCPLGALPTAIMREVGVGLDG